jgi:hypothetical protein
MRKQRLITLLLVAIALAGTLLVFASSAYVAGRSCKEKLEMPGKEENSGKMIWENLSHQFFSTF